MIKTINKTVDASADEAVWNESVLDGTNSRDWLSLSILLTSTGFVPNDYLLLYAKIAGLAGDDVLTSTITLENENNVFDGISGHPNETVISAIDGGAGDDTIAGTIYLGWEWGIVTNLAKGRGGDDTITLTNQYLQFDSEWGKLVESIAYGGGGDDAITLESTLAQAGIGSGSEGVTHLARGGEGDDTIKSEMALFLNDGTELAVLIYGGEGADVIAAEQFLSEGAFESKTEIYGGSGDDKISAQIDTQLFAQSAGVSTLIRGESGNDTITSTFINGDPDEDFEFQTSAVLDGGIGNDRISSFGGDAGDRNTFIGGAGNDRMWADGSVDEFVFVAGVNQGKDRIFNWDGSQDLLDVSGRTIAQIDAISSIASVGDDVVLTFDAGTVVTFKDVGLAGVDSVADLFWNGV